MIEVKKATLDDLEELAPLFDGYRIFYEKSSDLEGANAFLKERIEKNESQVFIAYSDGLACGFVQLYPLFSSTRMQRLWLLNDLYVNPDFRGKGASIALIDRAKQLCIETNSCGMMLETAKSNLIGNKLYPRTGFSLDEEHNFYGWYR